MTAVPPDQVATPGHSLSVVIPAYNEEAYVERCITALESVLIDIAADFEIIVVNDGSQDPTAAILESLTRSHHNLVVVHHEKNQGLGRTLYSFVYNWLIRIVFGPRIRDVNVSFEVVRTAALHEMKRRFGQPNLSSLRTIRHMVWEMCREYPSLVTIKPR